MTFSLLPFSSIPQANLTGMAGLITRGHRTILTWGSRIRTSCGGESQGNQCSSEYNSEWTTEHRAASVSVSDCSPRSPRANAGSTRRLSSISEDLSSVRETQLSIAVYIPHALSTRFEKFIVQQHTVVHATSWADLTVIIRQQNIDLVLVDPTVGSGVEIERIVWLLSEFPSIPIVVYTKMTPATFLAVHELSKRGLYRVMLYGCDDTPDRLALLFDGLPLRRMLPSVLTALRIDATTLPPLIQERMRAVFETSANIQSVAEFARSVSVSRQHLYNLFREAGLGPPGRFLLGAQLAQACAYLRDPGFTVAVVATRIGWTDPTALKRSLERAFGMSMAHLRRYQPAEHLVERLVDWIQSG